jgi:hypothetical protein
MNLSPAITVAAEINRLHEDAKGCSVASRKALHGALAAAWHAGQLLLAEKKRVRHSMGQGAWFLWLETNFRGAARTAQRYMRLAECVADIAFLQGMSLRQAYAQLGIATEPKTPSKRPLAHKLPAHIVLAGKLVRALKRRPGKTVEEQVEGYRLDLRGWLVEDFARDAKVRANFLGLVETGDLGGEDMADAFAEMAGELGSWQE